MFYRSTDSTVLKFNTFNLLTVQQVQLLNSCKVERLNEETFEGVKRFDRWNSRKVEQLNGETVEGVNG